MKIPNFFRKLGIWSITLGFILNTCFATPALAGRYVLNQTPTIIQGYFGEPVERIFGKNVMVYKYDTPQLHQRFPQFPKIQFYITFQKEKVSSITVNFNGDFDSYPDYNYNQETAFKFYEYIFGYQPPVWKLISDKFSGNETIHDLEYCLGDGVATSFTQWGYKQVTDYAIFYYDERCEAY